MTSRHFAIEGCIGVGKTTVAGLVAADLGCRFVGEKAELNPFLECFYRSPAQYALETELAFATVPYHQLKHAGKGLLVTDFTIEKDTIFAAMNLYGAEFACFDSLHRGLAAQLEKPDVVLFLRLPIEACLTRIRNRRISAESAITAEYLTALELGYMQHAESLGKVVEILPIDESQPPEAVAATALARIRELQSLRVPNAS